jgi:hypothetical protein
MLTAPSPDAEERVGLSANEDHTIVFETAHVVLPNKEETSYVVPVVVTTSSSRNWDHPTIVLETSLPVACLLPLVPSAASVSVDGVAIDDDNGLTLPLMLIPPSLCLLVSVMKVLMGLVLLSVVVVMAILAGCPLLAMVSPFCLAVLLFSCPLVLPLVRIMGMSLTVLCRPILRLWFTSFSQVPFLCVL